MTAYRDITVDLDHPSTITDWTATIMLDALRADSTGEVFSAEIRDACDAHPEADSGYMSRAKKALCNLGFPITSHKARHLSWFTLDLDDDQVEAHHHRMAREQYSERVSWVRSMADAAAEPGASPSIVALHAEGVMQAMGLARIVGMSPAEVVADCQPLSLAP